MKFEDLIGKTLSFISAEEGSNVVDMTDTEGNRYQMSHEQNCCEQVYINDICGDIRDLIGEPLTEASEEQGETPEGVDKPSDSYTWTFYKLGTRKGSVTIRWLGESNGYYSESVDFYLIKR
jgi:hypothetical protein